MIVLCKSHHAVVYERYGPSGFAPVLREPLFITLCRGCKGKLHALNGDYKTGKVYDDTTYIYGTEGESYEKLEVIARIAFVGFRQGDAERCIIDGKPGLKFSPDGHPLNSPSKVERAIERLQRAIRGDIERDGDYITIWPEAYIVNPSTKEGYALWFDLILFGYRVADILPDGSEVLGGGAASCNQSPR